LNGSTILAPLSSKNSVDSEGEASLVRPGIPAPRRLSDGDVPLDRKTLSMLSELRVETVANRRASKGSDEDSQESLDHCLQAKSPARSCRGFMERRGIHLRVAT
jgi:hypothetical protein